MSIPWYTSTKEYVYLCGGVNYEEIAAKEKQYGTAEVIKFLSADIPRNRLKASLETGKLSGRESLEN